MSDRIPISIVTGFLGSGKTTLIAALLRQPAMQDTAVMVNEFGAVGIDDAVFAQTLDADNVVLLANGCLCCAAGDDLASHDLGSGHAARSAAPYRHRNVGTGRARARCFGGLWPIPGLRSQPGSTQLSRRSMPSMACSNLEEHRSRSRQCAVADRRLITKVDLVDAARHCGALRTPFRAQSRRVRSQRVSRRRNRRLHAVRRAPCTMKDTVALISTAG